MAHENGTLNVIFNIHMTRSSKQLEIVFLSEGAARAAAVRAVPGNPHGTGVSRVLNNTDKQGCDRRGSLSPGSSARRTRGVMVVRATFFEPLVRHERR